MCLYVTNVSCHVSVRIQSEHKAGQPPCLPPFISGVSMILLDFLAQLESTGCGPGMGLWAVLQKPRSPQGFAGNQTLVW